MAPYPCWARADSTTTATGLVQIKGLHGNPEGAFWCPGEADFPLRGHSWSWRKGEENTIRGVDDLMERYVQTVGRNCSMLLGIVVDSRGLVPEADVRRLREFGAELNRQLGTPLEETHGDREIFTIDFDTPKRVNYVVIQEDISKGERVRKYQLLADSNGKWNVLGEGRAIGGKHRFRRLSASSLWSPGWRTIRNAGSMLPRH